jgi:hypothetical protein
MCPSRGGGRLGPYVGLTVPTIKPEFSQMKLNVSGSAYVQTLTTSTNVRFFWIISIPARQTFPVTANVFAPLRTFHRGAQLITDHKLLTGDQPRANNHKFICHVAPKENRRPKVCSAIAILNQLEICHRGVAVGEPMRLYIFLFRNVESNQPYQVASKL